MIYEILSIIPSNYSDTEIDGIIGKITAVCEKQGAKVQKSENLGKIHLAYPVKASHHGTYVLQYVDASTEVIDKVNLDIRLMDEVARHLTVACENGMPKGTFKMVSYEAPLTPEGKRATSKTASEMAASDAAPVAAPIEKISVTELDKKLDEILESDIVSDV
ncbi:MAG: 30S ribosomal protein S6 [Patescibacteria group bacterium]